MNGESNIYAKVPGFTMTFDHTIPLLFKIEFNAICHNPSPNVWVFPRIMVNDALIYNDKLIQNTADRYESIPGYTEVHMFDHIGVGQYAFFRQIATGIKKSELIYLQAGVYEIDVGVQAIGQIQVTIYCAVLIIELVQYDNAANFGDLRPGNATFVRGNGFDKTSFF